MSKIINKTSVISFIVGASISAGVTAYLIAKKIQLQEDKTSITPIVYGLKEIENKLYDGNIVDNKIYELWGKTKMILYPNMLSQIKNYRIKNKTNYDKAISKYSSNVNLMYEYLINMRKAFMKESAESAKNQVPGTFYIVKS